MSNPESSSPSVEADSVAGIEVMAFAEPDYALGFECAEPALQIEGWGQGEAALH